LVSGVLGLLGCATSQCPAAGTPEVVAYGGRQSYRLTDGRSEAIVVPSLGRVMRYGLVGGYNFLWNSKQTTFKSGEWKNWGGDKTWLAPQGDWAAYLGHGFPPDPVHDGTPHLARVLANGHLLMASQNSRAFGARLIREFWFDPSGDFIIKQTVEKTAGTPMMASLWNVTQIPPDIERVFVPLNADSPYSGGFYWFGGPNPTAEVAPLSPTLLRYRHTADASYKLGADSPVCAIAAVKAGVAFVERAPRPPGDYPEGASAAGFPVEVYNGGGAAGYTEMELLSPLRPLKPRDSFSQTLRWSLHELPAKDVAEEGVIAALEAKLLQPWEEPAAP